MKITDHPPHGRVSESVYRRDYYEARLLLDSLVEGNLYIARLKVGAIDRFNDTKDKYGYARDYRVQLGKIAVPRYRSELGLENFVKLTLTPVLGVEPRERDTFKRAFHTRGNVYPRATTLPILRGIEAGYLMDGSEEKPLIFMFPETESSPEPRRGTRTDFHLVT